MMLTTPPMALAPCSTEAGPRTTSMRSTLDGSISTGVP